MILKKMPPNVRVFHAVIVYCYNLEKLFPLLKKKMGHPIYPGLWGFPAGKVKPGEDLFDASIRELFEETGNRKERKNIIRLGICYPTLHHMYVTEKAIYFWAHMMLCNQPIVNLRISQEHDNLSLVTHQNILRDKFILVHDAIDNFADCLPLIRKHANIRI